MQSFIKIKIISGRYDKGLSQRNSCRCGCNTIYGIMILRVTTKAAMMLFMGSERNERVRLFKVRLRGQFIETLY